MKNCDENSIDKGIANCPNSVAIPMFDEPIIKVGASDDPLFDKLKSENSIGPHHMNPTQWLESANTVISIFLPISREVRNSNSVDMDWPSSEWLYARVEGQQMIGKLNAFIRDKLIEGGYAAVSPCLDGRLFTREGLPGAEKVEPDFTSNWSERHAAFICGMGTFGLSKGLITERGVAGRFTSIITNLKLKPDRRLYSGLYEYCSMCGACVRNCPSAAITVEGGKDHTKCAEYINTTRLKYYPRWGCGKCQIKVPCEAKPCKS